MKKTKHKNTEMLRRNGPVKSVESVLRQEGGKDCERGRS